MMVFATITTHRHQMHYESKMVVNYLRRMYVRVVSFFWKIVNPIMKSPIHKVVLIFLKWLIFSELFCDFTSHIIR